MNLLQLQNISKQYGHKVLFETASFSINFGEHVGVIGRNGAGKSTLFRMIAGQEEMDAGILIKSQGLRLAYLEQDNEWTLDCTPNELLEKDRIRPLWELHDLGFKLGLSPQQFEQSMHHLSGGYRMRVQLLCLLGQDPNLLLLDEPTNFLDLESLLALEGFLINFQGAILMISHDREFLRRTTEYTLEVEDGNLVKFPGNIDDYFEQKFELQRLLEAKAANVASKRKQIEDFVNRFGAKATKARQAQSRLKQLDRLEVVELKSAAPKSKIVIPEPLPSGKEILEIVDADIGYENVKVLSDFSFRLQRGQHWGVVGFNGAGKSTLLKSLASRLPLLSGNLKIPDNIKISYFSQHVSEELPADGTVISCLQSAAHSEISQQQILNLAGALLFAGKDIEKPIGVLSGGERSRVALGQLLLKKSTLLIMDEPTNHLDFETVESLTYALKEYSGSLIVVSHDRNFIRNVASQILEIRDGRVRVYPGTYDEYVWSLEKGALKDAASASSRSQNSDELDSAFVQPKADETTAGDKKFNYKEESKKLNAQLRETTKKIGKLESELQRCAAEQSALNDQLLTESGESARNTVIQLSEMAQKIQEAEEELLKAMEFEADLQVRLAEIAPKPG